MDIDVRNSTAAGHPARGLRASRGTRPGSDATTIPAAGEPGHGLGAVLRRHRAEGGYTALFELICYDCGDDPGLDYSEVIPRLQWLRGPRIVTAAWAAYERHLGLGLAGRRLTPVEGTRGPAHPGVGTPGM